MPETTPPRGPATTLRGWLSELFFPTLLAGELVPLEARLGPKATIDDPVLGRASGKDVSALLEKLSMRLNDEAAAYEKRGIIVGIDRDVSEGTLTFTRAGGVVTLPVAVVAERRPCREVELRIYHAVHAVHGAHDESAGRGEPVVRAPLVQQDEELSLPLIVLAHLDALKDAKLDALLDTFESNGTLRDANGVEHANDGGALRAFYEGRVGKGWTAADLTAKTGQGGVERVRGGAADDGRTCAVEFTTTHIRGEAIAPRPGLGLYERGDSGRLRSVRLYEDV